MFDVNLPVLQRAGLKVSPQMLRLARTLSEAIDEPLRPALDARIAALPICRKPTLIVAIAVAVGPPSCS